MNQLIRMFLLLTTAVTGLAACATQHQRFAPPGWDFVFEYPSGWKRSLGLQTVNFFHPEGKEVEARITIMPLNREEPRTAEEYLASTIEKMGFYGGHLGRKEVIQVSGRDATRLEFVEKHGRWGQASGVEIIVPHGAKYYVLSLFGKVADVALIRPEFDRLVSSLRLEPAPKSLMEWRGTYDGPKAAKRMVARTPEELRRMIGVFGLNILGNVIPASGFDFSAYMLVAISLGQQPTGGYWVKIEDAIGRDDVLHVRYRERSPSQSAVVTQALTAPFHIKVLPRRDGGKVLFERVAESETHEPD